MTRPASKASPRCGVEKKSGGTCGRPAGWGTEHVGKGPCKLHGGCLPPVVTRYAREEAVERARHWLDDEHLDIEPTDAALFNVRMGHAMLRFEQAKVRALDTPTSDDLAALDRAIRTAAHVTDLALKANIAERLVNIAERAGETLALICEDGIAALIKAGLKITPEQRALYARAIEESAAQHEDAPRELPLRAVG